MNAFTFDGPLFQATKTKIQHEFHRYHMTLAPEANGVNSGIQHLLDWLLFVQCAVHAIHNGLSWGLASEFDSDAVSMTRTLHIASASLRNTMNELYTEMPKFLEDVLELKEPMSAQQHNDNAVFWNSFQDLHEDLVNECTELELQYVNGKLHVKATPMPRPDLIQRVTKLMQGMFVFCHGPHLGGALWARLLDGFLLHSPWGCMIWSREFLMTQDPTSATSEALLSCKPATGGSWLLLAMQGLGQRGSCSCWKKMVG